MGEGRERLKAGNSLQVVVVGKMRHSKVLGWWDGGGRESRPGGA